MDCILSEWTSSDRMDRIPIDRSLGSFLFMFCFTNGVVIEIAFLFFLLPVLVLNATTRIQFTFHNIFHSRYRCAVFRQTSNGWNIDRETLLTCQKIWELTKLPNLLVTWSPSKIDIFRDLHDDSGPKGPKICIFSQKKTYFMGIFLNEILSLIKTMMKAADLTVYQLVPKHCCRHTSMFLFFINFTVCFPPFGILILIFIKFHRLVWGKEGNLETNDCCSHSSGVSSWWHPLETRSGFCSRFKG